ncbi:hypothetical protein DSC_11885 [Pseudoxanthomonas spadix BD-a59]|uniref:Uncharacterized protein n=1 Tax=Pseudoxanthomonas spadix (strain BD-a59) TaxID=1045855 RepID=G7UQU9_PSEUP|nr:hypothetical protein [Pseudoxanthomonas spadix]AER57021.1 hypothetical protein DSC_11885 [Pseudoxanthomonas spadix BD-a59]
MKNVQVLFGIAFGLVVMEADASNRIAGFTCEHKQGCSVIVYKHDVKTGGQVGSTAGIDLDYGQRYEVVIPEDQYYDYCSVPRGSAITDTCRRRSI